MKINIYINSSLDDDEISIEDNTLIFYFKSIKSYKEFRANPLSSKKFMSEYAEITTIKDYINSLNAQRFKKLFKRVKPTLKYHDENISSIDIPIIIDLSNISFDKKIEIITNPKVKGKNLFFADEFTTGEYISLNDYINMYQTILLDCEYIKSQNFSEAETLYYIYQKYKERIYKKEQKKEKCSLSRSLNQIIKRDTIVCVGYANYLNAIASILGLNVTSLSWSDEENIDSGHQENIAIINDSKHNINGIFAIDITWDSKRNDNDFYYLQNIRHFLMPLAYDKAEKSTKKLVLPSDGYYYIIFERYTRLFSLKGYNAPDYILDDTKKSIIKSINKLYKLLGIEPISFDCNLESEIEKVRKLSYEKIPIDTLKNIINNVTPKSEEELEKMAKTSYHYQMHIREIKLLRTLLGIK